MKAQLDLYGRKRLEFIEGGFKNAFEKPDPPVKTDALLAASDAALEEFVALKAAYFEKYRLEEKPK